MSGLCVDEETEILTVDGWETVHELCVGDEVLTLNHEMGMSEWQPENMTWLARRNGQCYFTGA